MYNINLLDKNNSFNILLAGIIGLFIGVGVARFAYTSLLPSMLDDKTLSLTFSGVLASTNYVGYLLGALFAVFIKDINTKVKYFRLGLVLCVASTIMMGVATQDILLIISRIIAGFGAAMTLVVGAAIVMVKLNLEDKTKAMGVYFSGIAIALAVSDIIARLVLAIDTWQVSWLALAFSAAMVAPYSWYILSTDQKIQTNNPNHSLDNNLFNCGLFYCRRWHGCPRYLFTYYYSVLARAGIFCWIYLVISGFGWNPLFDNLDAFGTQIWKRKYYYYCHEYSNYRNFDSYSQ